MKPSLRQLDLRRVNRLRLIGSILILLTVIIVVLAVENLLVSSLLAFVIAYLLGPLVNHLERNGMGRAGATVVVFTGAGLVLLGFAVLVFPYAADTLAALQAEAPKYITGLSHLIADTERKFSEFLGPISTSFDVTSLTESTMTGFSENFFDRFPKFVRQFITVMALAPFLAFFMVKDGRHMLGRVLAIVPNNIFEAALSLLHQINQQIGSFVRARLLESLIVGAVVWAGLVLMHFPFALALAFFAGLTNLIPYIGPLIGFAPALMIALVNHAHSVDLFLVFSAYAVAQIIDMAFLLPIVVAKIVDLHPVTVIIVIIAGAQILGILGMIISIPVAATLKVTIGTIYRHLTDLESRA